MKTKIIITFEGKEAKNFKISSILDLINGIAERASLTDINKITIEEIKEGGKKK